MAIVGAMTLARRAINVFALTVVEPDEQLADDDDALDIREAEMAGADKE